VLTPQAVLTGRFERKNGAVDVASVMREIDDARVEEELRRLRVP
jgi:RIO kinase 1